MRGKNRNGVITVRINEVENDFLQYLAEEQSKAAGVEVTKSDILRMYMRRRMDKVMEKYNISEEKIMYMLKKEKLDGKKSM